MQMLLKVMAQQFRVRVYLLNTYYMQGSIGVIQSFGKSLTPWRVGAGDKWKREENGKRRERKRQKSRFPYREFGIREAWVHMSALPCTV